MLLASINIFDVKFLSYHAEQMLDAHEGARLYQNASKQA